MDFIPPQNSPEDWLQQAKNAFESKHWHQAEQLLEYLYLQGIRLPPLAYLMYLQVLYIHKAFAQGLNIAQTALAAYPHHASLLQWAGYLAHDLGQPDLALDYYSRCLAQNPPPEQASEVCYYQLVLLTAKKDWEKAKIVARQAQARFPTSPIFTLFLGKLALQQRQFHQALPWFEKTLRLGYSHPYLNFLTAQTLRRLQQYTLAEALYLQAIQAQNTEPFQDFFHQFQSYQQASLQAHYQYGYGLCLLAQGKIQAGTQALQARFTLSGQTPIPLPIWQGQAQPAGHLFLDGEPGYFGYGDILQYLRVLPQIVVDFQGPITGYISQPLLRLCQHFFPRVHWRCTLPSNLTTDTDFSHQITLLDSFAKYADQLSPTPYFSQSPNFSPLPFPPAEGKIKIGIFWQSQAAQKGIPAELLSQLNLPDLQLYSLQPEPMEEIPEIISLARKLTDFYATARAILAMDLIISVDTAGLHLAGALGKPVWVLLNRYYDWRWSPVNRERWYQELRFFEQPSPGDWETVIGALKVALASYPKQKRDKLR